MIDFLFQQVPAQPLILFRICLGVVLIMRSVLLFREWTWYSVRGPFPNELSSVKMNDNVFRAMPVITLLASACLALGLQTQIAALILCACFTLLHLRNRYVSFGADTVQILFLLPLIFISSNVATVPKLLLLFLQVQLCVLYLKSAMTKLRGAAWRNGTAIYYVCALPNFTRFKLANANLKRIPTKPLSWAIIAIEFACPVMLFFPKLRLSGIVLLLFLHLSIEIFMNLQLFEWTMISGLALFWPF